MADNDNVNWVEKHRPETWSDIQGNNSDLTRIQDWLRNWEPGDKPILLIGPPGVGKTTTAYVASNDTGWPLTQVNASDKRKSEDIKQLAQIIRSNPVGAEHQILLLDEVDSQSGRADLGPLKQALDDAPCPIFMTANDKYEVPRAIKSRATVYEFKLDKRSRRAKLKEIVEKEDVDVSTRDIARLSDRPDLRSAINDLQVAAEMEENAVEEDDREWEQNIFAAVEGIVKNDEPFELKRSLDADPSDFLDWLDQNWRSDASSNSRNIRGIEMGVAYDGLSRSDKYLERFRTDTRYWKYAGALQEATGEVRTTETYGNWFNVNPPKWRRRRQRKVDDGTKEASLYKELSNSESGRFALPGSYTYFRKVLLPILQDMELEDRMQLAVDSRATDEEHLKALDIDPERFEDWKVGEWEETPAGGSALDW